MHVDDDGIGVAAEKPRRQRLLEMTERVAVEACEQPPHHLEHDDPPAPWRAEAGDAEPRCAGLHVERADDARLALDVADQLALVPGVVAERQQIGASGEQIGGNGCGQPEAAGRVLGIDDDGVGAEPLAQARQLRQDDSPAGPADDVTNMEYLQDRDFPAS